MAVRAQSSPVLTLYGAVYCNAMLCLVTDIMLTMSEFMKETLHLSSTIDDAIFSTATNSKSRSRYQPICLHCED